MGSHVTRGLCGSWPNVAAVRGLRGVVLRRVRAWNGGFCLSGAGGEGAGKAAARGDAELSVHTYISP
jgi:hypothetical protein